jgi:hypothetical protein
VSEIDLVVAVLATWRLSALLVLEDGPFDVFLNFRMFVGVYALGDDMRPKTFLGKLLECVWCTSVWAGVATFVISLTSFKYLLWPFAISAGAVIINELVVREES